MKERNLDKVMVLNSGHHIDFADEAALEGRFLVWFAAAVENFDSNNLGTIPGVKQSHYIEAN